MFDWSDGVQPFRLHDTNVVESTCPNNPDQTKSLFTAEFFNPINDASIILRSKKMLEIAKIEAISATMKIGKFCIKRDAGDEFLLVYRDVKSGVDVYEILIEFTELKQRENFLKIKIFSFHSKMKKNLRDIFASSSEEQSNEAQSFVFDKFSENPAEGTDEPEKNQKDTLSFPEEKPCLVIVGLQNVGKSTIAGMMMEHHLSTVSDYKCCTFFPVIYEYSLEKYAYVTSKKLTESGIDRRFIAKRGSSAKEVWEALCDICPEKLENKEQTVREYGEDTVITVGWDAEMLKSITIVDTIGPKNTKFQKSVLDLCMKPNSLILAISAATEHNLDDEMDERTKSDELKHDEFMFVSSLNSRIRTEHAKLRGVGSISESVNQRLIFASNKCHLLIGGRDQFAQKESAYKALGMTSKRKKFDCSSVSSNPAKQLKRRGKFNENELLEKHEKKLKGIEQRILKHLKEDKCLGQNFSGRDVFAVSISPNVFDPQTGDLSDFKKIIELYAAKFRNLVTRILEKAKNMFHVAPLERYFANVFTLIRSRYEMLVNKSDLNRTITNVRAVCLQWMSEDRKNEIQGKIRDMMNDTKPEFKRSICRQKINVKGKGNYQMAHDMINDCIVCCINNQVQMIIEKELNEFVKQINHVQTRAVFTVSNVPYPSCCEYQSLFSFNGLWLLITSILRISVVIKQVFSEVKIDRRWKEECFDKIYETYSVETEHIAEKSWKELKKHLDLHFVDVNETVLKLQEEEEKYKLFNDGELKDLENTLLEYNMKATSLAYIALENRQVRGFSAADSEDEPRWNFPKENLKKNLNEGQVEIYEDEMIGCGENELVAVKIVKYGKPEQNAKQYSQRLFKEVYLMQTFRHRLLNGLVSAYHDENNQTVFFVTKQYQRNLTEIFDKHNIKVRMEIFLELVEGIGVLHHNGIYLQNLEPENVYLQRVGQSEHVVIDGFGLTAPVDRERSYYQLETHGHDGGSCDIYSASIILRQLWDSVSDPEKLWESPIEWKTTKPKALHNYHGLNERITRLADFVMGLCGGSIRREKDQGVRDIKDFYCSVHQLKEMIENRKFEDFAIQRWEIDVEYPKFPWEKLVGEQNE